MTGAILTGSSILSPAGRSADETFAAALAGRCAGTPGGLASPLDRVPLALLPTMPELGPLLERWPERSAAMAVLAARHALADAGLDPTWMRRERSAIVVGTSKAGALSALAAADAVAGQQGRGAAPSHHAVGGNGARERPLFPWATPACAASALAAEYQPGGGAETVVAACASGLAALVHGARLIRAEQADTVLVVTADATLHPLFVGAFARLGVLARWRDKPADACRPFAADRCGFVLAEGAAAVVLQGPHLATRQLSDVPVAVTAWAQGAQATDLVRADGDGDAHRPDRPGPAETAYAKMLTAAMARAGWSAGDVQLVHAHATGTSGGDLVESRAIRLALGAAAERAPVISTKPITGHMLGAAGLVQAILTARAMRSGMVPPTANLRRPDPRCDLDYNASGPRPADLARTLTLAWGFGGSIVAVAMERR